MIVIIFLLFEMLTEFIRILQLNLMMSGFSSAVDATAKERINKLSFLKAVDPALQS